MMVTVSAFGKPVLAASLFDISGAAWRATADSEVTLLGGGLHATLHVDLASWLALDFDAAAIRARRADGSGGAMAGAVSRYGQAGATVRPARGWNASLFVTSFDARPSTDDDAMRVRSSSFVSGRITRHLGKSTRVSLDMFNLFDKRTGNIDHFSATRLWSYPGAADNFLFYPGESRGMRLRLRTTF
jgi:hypothetical protein